MNTLRGFGNGVVDDEEFIRKLGARVLSQSRYEVLSAGNGVEALEVCRRQKNALSQVILDLIMPEMGAKQCLEELLKIDPDAKVVISSGFSVNGPTKTAVERGAGGFVDKPFDMSQLLQTVRFVLDKG